jgi:hypothetical protein
MSAMKKRLPALLALLVLPLASAAMTPKAAIVLAVHGSAQVHGSDHAHDQLKLLMVLHQGDALTLAPGAHVLLAFSVGGARVALDGPCKGVVLEPGGLKGTAAHPQASTMPMPDDRRVEVELNKMGGISGRSLAHVVTRQSRPALDLSALPREVNLSGPTMTAYLRRVDPTGPWTPLPVRVLHREDGRTTVQPSRDLAPGLYELNLDSQPGPTAVADFNLKVLPAGALTDLDTAELKARSPQATTADKLAMVEWLVSYHLYDDACQELSTISRSPSETQKFSDLEASIHQQRAAYESGFSLHL